MAERMLRAVAHAGTWAEQGTAWAGLSVRGYEEGMTTGALFTIGYKGRTQDEYLELLRDAGVTLLADVRRNPISRKKGFSKSTLAQDCVAVGIRYEHLPELGVASEKRKGSPRRPTSTPCSPSTAGLAATQGPAMAKLRAWLDAGERVALTCFER